MSAAFCCDVVYTIWQSHHEMTRCTILRYWKICFNVSSKHITNFNQLTVRSAVWNSKKTPANCQAVYNNLQVQFIYDNRQWFFCTHYFLGPKVWIGCHVPCLLFLLLSTIFFFTDSVWTGYQSPDLFFIVIPPFVIIILLFIVKVNTFTISCNINIV